jgi:capsular polysaccharide export protein
LRREIEALTGMTPVRFDGLRRRSFDAVAGWGHKPTADRARRLATQSGKPYLAFEDGPIRSLRPGREEPPLGMVIDRSGIYYDATTRSDLVAMVEDSSWFTPTFAERAGGELERLKQLKLSKYNAGPERTPEQLGLGGRSRRVLVVDQVHGDAAIPGAFADAASFSDMLAAALDENPNAEVVLKLHPEVLSGRRGGYFPDVEATDRIKIVAQPANPWSLLEAVDAVYTVSSGLGFEAALAGKRVVCFGSPFYAGWGFTDDRRLKVQRPRKIGAPELFAAYYLRYTRYLDAYSRREIPFEAAIEQLAWLRDCFLEQERRPVCYRITRWKRGIVDRMLDGPAGRPLHAVRAAAAVALAKEAGGPVVAWASRDNSRIEAECRHAGVALIRVEDGFVRSAGLGASFVVPLSLVFDRRGIYYDSRTESDLEALLSARPLPPDLIERASCLRRALVAAGTTKYNVGGSADLHVESGTRPIVLVPGQVEDDASIERGSPLLKRNVDLLRAVRERHPDAFVLYKPHPDVEAGIRSGRVPAAEARRFADRIASNASILQLIGLCDRMETMTSLAGFEALLRGKPVTTHGQPFYAGWGLTEDLCRPPRRQDGVTLDELVAAALILYPRYLDPATGRLCGPELLIERLGEAARRELPLYRRLMRLGQMAAARALHLGHSVKVLTWR